MHETQRTEPYIGILTPEQRRLLDQTLSELPEWSSLSARQRFVTIGQVAKQHEKAGTEVADVMLAAATAMANAGKRFDNPRGYFVEAVRGRMEEARRNAEPARVPGLIDLEQEERENRAMYRKIRAERGIPGGAG